MNPKTLNGMIEQATRGDLPKPDMNINKKICFAVRDQDSLYCNILT